VQATSDLSSGIRIFFFVFVFVVDRLDALKRCARMQSATVANIWSTNRSGYQPSTVSAAWGYNIMMMMMIMITKIVMISKTVERTQWASPATVILIPQGSFGGDDDYNIISTHTFVWARVRAYKCLSDNSGLPIVTCDRCPCRSRTAHVYET